MQGEGIKASEALCHHSTGQTLLRTLYTLLRTDIWATGNAAAGPFRRSVKERSELECCQVFCKAAPHLEGNGHV